MKKTRITVTAEINDTEDTFKTAKDFNRKMKDCGQEGETVVSRNCDDNSCVFSYSENDCEAHTFCFNDFATFINKYSVNIAKWEIIRALLDYYCFDDIKAEMVDVVEENKEENNE